MTKRFSPRGTANFPGGVTSGAPGTGSSANGVTAHAGGGQASATPVSARINRVTTCATANDSVTLPPAKAGAQIAIINSGAASCQVFGTTPDTINGVATGTGVALAVGKVADFLCALDGAWFMNLTA